MVGIPVEELGSRVTIVAFMGSRFGAQKVGYAPQSEDEGLPIAQSRLAKRAPQDDASRFEPQY